MTAPSQAGTSAAEVRGCARRQLLKAMGVLALGAGGVGTLVSCTTEEAGTPPTGTGAPSGASSAASSASSASSAPASSSSSASGSASSSAPDGIRVLKSKIPVGGGLILTDADYVVTQPTSGEFKAFSKICTHQQNPVGEIRGTNIVCNFHGSQFSIADGAVTSPPATQPLPAAEIAVTADAVVILT